MSKIFSYDAELHLVHYKSTYDNFSAAVHDGQPDSLAVVGIFLRGNTYPTCSKFSEFVTPSPLFAFCIDLRYRIHITSLHPLLHLLLGPPSPSPSLPPFQCGRHISITLREETEWDQHKGGQDSSSMSNLRAAVIQLSRPYRGPGQASIDVEIVADQLLSGIT